MSLHCYTVHTEVLNITGDSFEIKEKHCFFSEVSVHIRIILGVWGCSKNTCVDIRDAENSLKVEMHLPLTERTPK